MFLFAIKLLGHFSKVFTCFTSWIKIIVGCEGNAGNGPRGLIYIGFEMVGFGPRLMELLSKICCNLYFDDLHLATPINSLLVR